MISPEITGHGWILPPVTHNRPPPLGTVGVHHPGIDQVDLFFVIFFFDHQAFPLQHYTFNEIWTVSLLKRVALTLRQAQDERLVV